MMAVKDECIGNGFSKSIVLHIGKLECDFIVRYETTQYSYVQVAMTILSSQNTEDREYKPLEEIKDNYPKYVVTRNDLIQHRNGIIHVNIGQFMRDGKMF